MTKLLTILAVLLGVTPLHAQANELFQFEGCYRTILWEGEPIKLKPGQGEKIGRIRLGKTSIYQDLNHQDFDSISVEWFVGDWTWGSVFGDMMAKQLILGTVVEEVPGKFVTRIDSQVLYKGKPEHLRQCGILTRLESGDINFKYSEEHDDGGLFGSEAILRKVSCQ